jgi:hypothetical protein
MLSAGAIKVMRNSIMPFTHLQRHLLQASSCTSAVHGVSKVVSHAPGVERRKKRRCSICYPQTD